MKNKKVWFVTGCSKGLGYALVNELLKQGYMVSATSRSTQALIDAFGNESEQFLPLMVNLADEESVKTALQKTVLKFGRVDVVVNNAGYTHLATIEEMSDKAVRDLFDINVFGTLNVIRNAPESLPMGTDCCNGIREIALNTARLMDEMQDTASYTDF